VFRFRTGGGATLVGLVLGTGREGLVLGHQQLRRRGVDRAARVHHKRLLVIPGGGHGTGLLEFGEDAPKLRAAVRGFIADRTRA
jgi:hypothetical protein